MVIVAWCIQLNNLYSKPFSYLFTIYQCTKYLLLHTNIIVRMAKAAKRLQAILDYMKKVKLITSTVYGQFP